MNISIIIPTLNAEKHFSAFREALVKQTVQPCEIVVIDSQSTDRTATLFEGMGAKVLTIEKAQFQHGRVRNMGAKETKGDILIFMTQDAIPANEFWLECLIKPICQGKAEASFARQVPYADAGALEQYARSTNYPSESRIVSQDDIQDLGGKAFFFSNSCSAIKKEVFETLGGFTVGTIMNEDMLFAAKILQNGYKIAYVAEAVVNHSHDYNFKQTFKRYFDIGVVMRQAQYDIGAVGMTKTGLAYVRGLMRFLLQQKKYQLIPSGMFESGIKWLGFNLGKLYPLLPQSVLMRLSMHGGYWNKSRYPFSFLNSFLTPGLFILTDVLIITLCMLIAYFLRSTILPGAFGIEPFVPVTNYLTLWPLVAVLILLRSAFGLYPGYGLNPADELRRQTLSSSLVFFFAFAGATLFQFNEYYSRVVLLLTSIFVLAVLPIARAFSKEVLSRSSFYGTSIWMIGNSERANEFCDILERSPVLGLKVVGFSRSYPEEGFAQHCLVIPDDLEVASFSDFLDKLHRKFTHVWVAPNLLNTASVWVTPRDLNGNLTLELRNKLLEPRNEILKRLFDFLMSFILTVTVLPLMLIIAFVIRIDSKGPVIHRQKRIGRFGRVFTTYKFRSMKVGAEQELARYLEHNPSAKQEWQTKRKLEHDPRVTRVGKFLRRSSLDELPQLLNIFKGDMSFVGPRPIVKEELSYYSNNAHLYTQVLPGLTGLMQVSGRSDLSYEERVKLDSYYARNWSVWLDIVVLAKTVVAVATRRGAF
jgi:exopolysaccharide biosynthesis polyprenyl glycosylphosphotransferase